MVIARTHTKLCPVRMLERYVEVASIGGDPDKFVFRGMVSTKAGSRLRSSGSLSYTRMRELVLEKLSQIGLDKTKYGVRYLE